MLNLPQNALPCYAVIFTSIKKINDPEYDATSKRMVELAHEQNGFLGYESAREEIGITISYWSDTASIAKWKQQIEHKAAQKKGIKEWYSSYRIKVCKVERAYGFN